ncbi:glycosyl hydrolase family 18 protein [Aestuariimicrobium soli]|uniref:glycosyl hydrolase family 18 protein n=1 Tax=Aestuariimicrobium soli TaxID=2035834 RepID=UPI003EB8592F
MTPRIIAYHQSHGHGETFVPLETIGTPEAPLTHLIIAAVHLTDDGLVTLNDHPHDDPHHDQLWRAVAGVQSRGVPVMAMVGGWAPGTTEKLTGEQFDRFYPLLRDALRAHRLDGVDVDVEQDMALDDVIRIIDALRADFGPDFIIALAPVQTALVGGKNLSGFDYDELERRRGAVIDFHLVQFYSGFASADDANAYRAIIERAATGAGAFTPDRVLLGQIGEPADASFIPLEPVAETVRRLVTEFPDFGGVDIWEFPIVDGRRDIGGWARLMRDALRGADA